MVARHLQQASKIPSVVFAVLLLISMLGFIAVNHLVVRFHEQEKALGRRLYALAQAEQSAGRVDRAIPYLRAAISYSRDNPQYQLGLARALRDTGRTDEAESYLIRLWEKDPQDGPINLALGRLFARENDVARAIQYYHNAAYGVWAQNSADNGLGARFELVRYLLQRKAATDAQSELISMSSSLPDDPALQLQLGDLFFQAQDFQRALAEYEHVLRKQPSQLQAAVGAGKAAFQLHRYREAEKYFSRAAANDQAKPLLEVVRVILDSDPDDPAISASERVRRIKKAFQHAGSRLDECREDSAVVADLRQRWGAVKSKVLRTTHFNDDLNAAMGLVFEIEQQTQRCAPAAPTDQALLLLANDGAYSHP